MGLIMDGNVVKKVCLGLEIEGFKGIGGCRNGNGEKKLEVMDGFVSGKI